MHSDPAYISKHKNDNLKKRTTPNSEQQTGNWPRMACLNAKLSPKNGQPGTAPNNFHGYRKIT